MKVLLFIIQLLALASFNSFSTELEIKEADDAYAAGNYTTAVKIYEKLTSENNLEASCALGWIYMTSAKSAEDIKKGISLTLSGSNKGHPGCQYNAGVLYMEGKLVDRDYKKGWDFFQLAANANVAMAIFNLGVMSQLGLYVKRNDELAVKYYRLASQLSVAQAQLNLGNAYFNGEGVIKNLEKAHSWYYISEKLGNANAAVNLRLTKNRLNRSQVIEAEKLANRCIAEDYKNCE